MFQGLPYKYILAVETRPFQDAPDALLKALQRLRWAGKHVGQSEEEQFNEILAVGYYEQGKMGVSTISVSYCIDEETDHSIDSTMMMERKGWAQWSRLWHLAHRPR